MKAGDFPVCVINSSLTNDGMTETMTKISQGQFQSTPCLLDTQINRKDD